MCFLELFTNVEKVNLTTRHHDAYQRSVICTKALQRSIDTFVAFTEKPTDTKCITCTNKSQKVTLSLAL